MQLWIRGLQEAWGSQSLKDEVFQVLYEGNFVYLQMSRAKRGKGEGGGGYDSQVNMFVIKLLPGANISNLVSVCMVGLKFVFSENPDIP